MAEELPTAVWSGSFTVFGIEVKCHTLDDGRRIIEAESFESLVKAMENGATTDQAELERMLAWQEGAPNA